MILDFHYLRQCPIWARSRYDESLLFHLFSIERIEFESMTMSFSNLRARIHLFGKRSWPDNTWIASEAHIPSFCHEILLMIHDVDNIMFSFWSEFLTRCIENSESISSKFDRHNLRSETDSEKWNLMSSCMLRCLHHSECSTDSESSRYTDSIESF